MDIEKIIKEALAEAWEAGDSWRYADSRDYNVGTHDDNKECDVNDIANRVFLALGIKTEGN